MRRGERGAGSVLALAMMGLLVLVTLGVVSGVAVVGVHRRAQSAADLAALAGAGALQNGQDPCTQAASVARANRATLSTCSVDGWTVSLAVVAAARLPVGVLRLPARARAGPVSP